MLTEKFRNNFLSSQVGSRVTYVSNKKASKYEPDSFGHLGHCDITEWNTWVPHVHAIKELVPPKETNINSTTRIDWPASSKYSSQESQYQMKIGGSEVNNTSLKKSENLKKDDQLKAPSQFITTALT